MRATDALQPSDEVCTREELARGAHCKIERCRCGVLHLMVGPVTIRTTPGMAQELLGVLDAAVRQLTLRTLETNGSTAAIPDWNPAPRGKPGKPS